MAPERAVLQQDPRRTVLRAHAEQEPRGTVPAPVPVAVRAAHPPVTVTQHRSMKPAVGSKRRADDHPSQPPPHQDRPRWKDAAMPLVQVHLAEGRTPEQKRALLE